MLRKYWFNLICLQPKYSTDDRGVYPKEDVKSEGTEWLQRAGKLDRRHTGRLRKRDGLLGREGEGRITRPQESLRVRRSSVGRVGCSHPPKGGGGAHSPAGEGVEESQLWRLEKKLSSRSTLRLKANGSYFCFAISPLLHQTSVINKLTWRTFLSASATGDTRFSGGKTGASHCTKCYIIPFPPIWNFTDFQNKHTKAWDCYKLIGNTCFDIERARPTMAKKLSNTRYSAHFNKEIRSYGALRTIRGFPLCGGSKIYSISCTRYFIFLLHIIFLIW